MAPGVFRVRPPRDHAPAQRACLALAQARVEQREHERVHLGAAFAGARDERLDRGGIADRSPLGAILRAPCGRRLSFSDARTRFARREPASVEVATPDLEHLGDRGQDPDARERAPLARSCLRLPPVDERVRGDLVDALRAERRHHRAGLGQVRAAIPLRGRREPLELLRLEVARRELGERGHAAVIDSRAPEPLARFIHVAPERGLFPALQRLGGAAGVLAHAPAAQHSRVVDRVAVGRHVQVSILRAIRLLHARSSVDMRA